MILTLIGWFYIIIGLLFLLQPEKSRDRFRAMDFKVLKQFCSALAIVIGLGLIIGTWNIPGFLGRLFLVFGFIALIKSYVLYRTKYGEEKLKWWLEQDVQFFRTISIVEIIFGALILSI